MKRVVFFLVLFSILGLWLVAQAANPPADKTVYQVQRACPNGIAVGDSIRLRDVIITGIDVRSTTYGFWAQEAPGSNPLYPYYSGILCYTSAAFPTGLQIGDKMTVVGVYAEYPGPTCADTAASLSENNSYYPWFWTKTGTAPVPNATLLSAYDVGVLSSDAPRAERWEGVLVKLDTVVCTSYDPTYPNSSWWVKEAHNHPPSTTNDSVYVRTNKLPDPYPGRPNIGDTLVSLTGLHHWETGRYQICPRNGDDIVYKGAAPPPNLINAFSISRTGVIAVFDTKLDPVTSQNINFYSLATGPTVTGAVIDPVDSMMVTLTTTAQTDGILETLTACCIKGKSGTAMPASENQSYYSGLTPISYVQTPKSGINDSSQIAGSEATLAGIVTGDKGTFITQFYLENTPGGPWSGIQVYGGTPINPVEGDSVIVAGFVAEFNNKTELSSVDYITVVSSGNPVPGPNLVAPNAISTGSPTAESYEGVFVRCDPVFCVDTTGWQAFGEWDISDNASHTVKIGHSGDYNFFPHVGRWMNIRGPMDFVFGNFRMEPRRDADIDTVNVIGVEPGTTPKPQVFALEQNTPNPFNPVTTIFYSVPVKTQVDLYVYDVTGKVVKRLVDGVTTEPGRHKATWDGKTDAGRAVSSGVYFAKLMADNKVAKVKMVILK